MQTSVAALALAVAVSACGGSPKVKHANTANDPMLAMSRCMRAHGVTRFPDPQGHGINLQGTGVDPRSPAFRAARTVCFKLLPGGGPNTKKASAEQIRQADQTARCMREHGVNGFPDPIIATGPPNLDPAKYSSIEAGGGIIIAIPRSIDEQAPAFQSASKACAFHG